MLASPSRDTLFTNDFHRTRQCFDKTLSESKRYNARGGLAEFPNKNRTLRGVNKLIRLFTPRKRKLIHFSTFMAQTLLVR